MSRNDRYKNTLKNDRTLDIYENSIPKHAVFYIQIILHERHIRLNGYQP